MKDKILSTLNQIELEHNVKILYAAESGSRAWGFASDNSDWDVRFIYIRPMKEYLKLQRSTDVLDKNYGLANVCDEWLDFSGWDIYKALGLFHKSNPPMVEWLRSPIVYREEGTFADNIRQIAAEHISFRRLGFHHWSLANGNWKDYLLNRDVVSRKKYLYVLRALFCVEYSLEHKVIPPINMRQLMDGIWMPAAVREWTHQIIDEKAQSCDIAKRAPIPELDGYIALQLESQKEALNDFQESNMPIELLDEVIRKELGL